MFPSSYNNKIFNNQTRIYHSSPSRIFNTYKLINNLINKLPNLQANKIKI